MINLTQQITFHLKQKQEELFMEDEFDFEKILKTVSMNARSVWVEQEKEISKVCDLITGDCRYIILAGLGT